MVQVVDRCADRDNGLIGAFCPVASGMLETGSMHAGETAVVQSPTNDGQRGLTKAQPLETKPGIYAARAKYTGKMAKRSEYGTDIQA